MRKVAVFAGSVAAMGTVAALAFAQGPANRGSHVKVNQFGQVPGQPTASASAAPAVVDAGAKVAVESRQKRKDYLAHIDPQIVSTVHAGNKQVTQEERNTIGTFQHRLAILFRIREVAELEGDADTKAKCDALQGRMEAKLLAKLHAENAKAPAK